MLTKKEIGNNLRIFAKNKGYTLSYIADFLGMKLQSFRNYYEGNSIPGGELLSKLSNLGCDINWLLNGTHSPSSVKEPEAPYSAAIDERFKAMEERLAHLEKMNGKWQQYSAEVLNQYKTDCQGKDEIIARLSVQFVTLVAANQFVEKLENGNNIIE